MPQAGSRAVLFLTALVLIDTVGFGIIIPVTPALIMDLGDVDVSQAAIIGGWLFFSFAITQFLAAPVLGNLSDRYGRRPVLLLSLAMFGIDYLLMGFAPTLGLLFLGRVLAGIPGASYTPAFAYIADVTPPEERAKRFGMLGAAFGVGFILGPAIGGLLAGLGPRAPFFAAAALAFLNLGFGWFVLPESLPVERRRPFSWKRANPVGALAHLRDHKGLLALAAVFLLVGLAGQVYPTVWSFYTIHRFGWTEALVGMSLAFAGVLMAVSQGGLTGVLLPRLGEWRGAIVALAASALGFLGFALATQTWMMFAWMTTSLLAGLGMPALSALMSRKVPPDQQGELQGANASLMSLASVIAPLVLPPLFGAFARPDAPIAFPGAPFLASAILSVAAIGLLLVVPREASAPAPPPGPAEA